jgi:hypothetical protein
MDRKTRPVTDCEESRVPLAGNGEFGPKYFLERVTFGANPGLIFARNLQKLYQNSSRIAKKLKRDGVTRPTANLADSIHSIHRHPVNRNA